MGVKVAKIWGIFIYYSSYMINYNLNCRDNSDFMNEKTSVQVTKETVERLKKHRLVDRETYNEVINRLIDKYEQKE